MKSYSVYIKYQSYVEFYRMVETSLNELCAARPSCSTIVKVIEKCRKNAFSVYAPVELSPYEKYDDIIHKVEQERNNQVILNSINSAAAQFTHAVNELCRPTLKTVLEALDSVVLSVSKDLLDV